MIIGFYDTEQYDKDFFVPKIKKTDVFKFFGDNVHEHNIDHAKGCDAICTFVNCDLSAGSLKRFSEIGIKYIFQRSAGYNNIDLKAAEKYNIKVFRVPAYSPESVAEFAMTLLMSVNRNIPIASMRTKFKDFSINGLQGHAIFGSTIGVVGAGRIGTAFVNIANGCGANVIVYDSYAEKHFPESAKKHNFQYVSKDTLFKESDFLSLHAPSTPETKYIINKNTIKLMKKNAIIINTARGDLIQTCDLLDALDTWKIRGAGLDVFENEAGIFFKNKSNDLLPDILLTRLRAHRNVLLTAHQSFLTNEALEQISSTTMQNIEDAKIKNYDKALKIIEGGRVKNG